MAHAAADRLSVTWQPLPAAGSRRHDAAGALVYAIGDVHGCYDLLADLLAAIAADATSRAGTRRPILVLCGDYVDRGPRSADVLEAICWLRRHGPYELRLLLGNHEQAMLDFIADPLGQPDWLAWGGEETLRAYGVAPPGEDDPHGRLQARNRLLDILPAAHLHLLETLEHKVEIGDYLFAHAGVKPGRALADQRLEDLLWIRGEFLDHGAPHPKMVVHGHSWQSQEPEVRSNRIGIDTGAFATDVLTALRLDGTDRAFAQVTGAARA